MFLFLVPPIYSSRMQQEGIISINDDKSDADVSDDDNYEPAGKKVRVSTASVHNEFVQRKEAIGKWISKCKHCTIKDTIYKHKNSSALLIHLEKKHPAVHKKCVEEDKKEREGRKSQRKEKEIQVKAGSTSSGHTTAAAALFSKKKGGAGAGPLDRYMQTGKQILPGWKQEKIIKKYAYWLGASGLPISAITEDSNFKDFITEINPDVKLPSRGKVMKDCSSLSEEVQARMKSAFENAKKVSVTVDIWSSTKCKNSYLGLTVHLFNHGTMKRESYRIACRKFDCAHTGENIARKIDSIMLEYGIQAKVFYCLSDNGSNMKKGLRLISEDSEVLEEELDDDCWDAWDDRFESEETEEGDEGSDSESEDLINNNNQEEEEEGVNRQLSELEQDQDEHRRSFNRVGLKRLGCYPHTFQLAILKSTKKKNNAFGKMLKKTRKFVVKYRRSPKAKAVLQKTQFKKRLLGYCRTRWWTDQVMLKRLCEAMECDQVPSPLEVLADAMDWPIVISERDFQYMKAYTHMMEPLMEKSDQLGAETVSTIHMVYPTLMEVIEHLDDVSRKPLCKALATDLKKNIKYYFNHLIDPLDINFDPIAITATFLSPVHRHILSEEQIKIAEDHIKILLDSYDQSTNTAPEETGEIEVEEEKTITIPGLKFLSKKIIRGNNGSTSDPAAALKRDLDQYQIKSKQVLNKLMQSASHKVGEEGEMKTRNPTDPMDFWVKELLQSETALSSLALDIMAIPASSVPSERLFSISGLLSSGLDEILVNFYFISYISGKLKNIGPGNLEKRVLLKSNKFLN